MRDTISRVVHCASWLAAIVAVIATVAWGAIVADGNYCWSAFAFTITAMPLGGGTLLLGVVPSGGLYFRNRQHRDLKSLWLAGCSFVVLFGEAALLNVIPMRGE